MAVNLFSGGNFINSLTAAGKNKIINGDFGIWQRGTSFTGYASRTYTADRWTSEYSGTGATRTVSRQTFTPGTAPVSGYEGQYYLSYNRSVAGTSPADYLTYRVEDVRTFAGQTATISFWAKANASMSLSDITFYQEFGSGGSATSTTTTPAKTITTSWARYTTTVSVPSVSGKTIGTSSDLAIYFVLPNSGTFTFDIWGVQLEQGSTATPFQTASGTIQGELALCQRYYWRFTGPGAYSAYGFGAYGGTTTGYILMDNPVTFRTTPTSLDYANLAVQLTDGGGPVAVTNLAIDQNSLKNTTLLFTVGTAGTAFRPCRLLNNNNTAGYVGLNAEL